MDLMLIFGSYELGVELSMIILHILAINLLASAH
jgi:hypothetical protein